jgi:putative hydrolase of the HAD superfamily
MPELKGGLLDAGGTLFRVKHSRAERIGRFLREVGFNPDPEALERATVEADLEFGWPEPDVRSRDEEWKVWLTYCRRVLAALELPADPELVRRLAEAADYLKYLEVFPDTVPALEAWRRQGLRLGIISNATPSFREAIDRVGLTPFFDTIIISAEVGLRKPDRAIFRLGLQRLHLEPGEAFFIDDLPRNVQAARDLGLTGLLIVRSPEVHPPEGLPAVRRLTDFLGGQGASGPLSQIY